MTAYDPARAAGTMRDITDTWSLGYGQGPGVGGRHDIRDGGAADCSSLVATAIDAGYGEPVGSWRPLGADTWTGNLGVRLLGLGWTAHPGATRPQVGDVLIADGHTSMCTTPTPDLSEAAINELGTLTGGRPGDQTGQETRTIPWSTHPLTRAGRWTTVLRPPTTTPLAQKDPDMAFDNADKTKLANLSWLMSNSVTPALARLDRARIQQAAELAGIRAALAGIAADRGIDRDAIQAAITDAVTDAMRDVTITLSTEGAQS